MRNVIGKFYLIIALTIVVNALGLFLQYDYFNKTLSKENQIITQGAIDTISRKISSNLNEKAQVINTLSEYIALEKWNNDELLSYMKGLLKNNKEFSAIYYGTTNNFMINGTGWIPPEGFDLRIRPWYIKAVNENKLIFTEAFINASKDKLIVTIAKPIYNSSNQLIGVVAGDVSIDYIISIVKDNKIMEGGYSFLIDGKGNILAHPKYEYSADSKLKKINDISKDLNIALSNNKSGITKLHIDDSIGYLAYQSIENTDWKVGSFIPLDDFVKPNDQYLRIFITILLSSIIFFVIFFIYQKAHIIKPINTLVADIKNITIEKDSQYRLPLDEHEEFAVIRKTMNNFLSKLQELFVQIEFEEEKIRVANEELAVTVQQLENLSFHDQLTGLYNRRFFEEELRRLDVERNYPLTVVMADVNGLKLVNDSFGHAIGDELLIKVSQVLKKGVRSDDIIARLGGDEFVILIPKTDAYETEVIIKRIKALALMEKAGSIDISISFGCCSKTDASIDITEVLKKAEDHMYREKLLNSPSVRGRTINAIISTLCEKNKREELHSHRVSTLCESMGKALNLSQREIQELKTAGLLHDIGKIAVEDCILNKPGMLLEDEWEQIKKHPEIGYRILSTVNDLSEIADYVLAHHERWDGKGYPKELKGKDIPLQSRIIAIVDTFDAITSERSYREALSEEFAIEELNKNAEAQFDSELVAVFIEKVLGKHKK